MQVLKLRFLTLEDIKEIAKWPKFITEEDRWANLPVSTLAEGEEWLNCHHHPPQRYSFAIEEARGKLVGRVSLTMLDEGTNVAGIFGFVIRPDLNGLGYGTAAIKHVVEFSFATLNLSALYLYAEAHNLKARRLYQKAGFRYMGAHTEYRESRGEVRFVDLVYWREY